MKKYSLKTSSSDDSLISYLLASGGFLQGFGHIFMALVFYFRSSTGVFTHLVIGICLIFSGYSLIKGGRDNLTLTLATLYVLQAAVRFSAENAYWGVIDIIVGLVLLIIFFRWEIKSILVRIGIRISP